MHDVTYRDLGKDDLPVLHEIGSHWHVVRQLGSWPWPPDPAFTLSRCRPYRGTGFVWAVCRNDRLIGTMAVTGGELGYMFAPDTHGQGIATVCARDAIAHAFANYSWPELRAVCWHDNRASARVLGKCGFVHWQTLYEQSKARRLPVLTHRFRLSRPSSMA